MTGPILVSVIVPAFNEEATVERAYRSIAEVFQGLPGHALELIFMDNHSTDATFPLLQAIAAIDPRVRVVRLSRNNGYQRSLLLGYQRARGACAVQIDCDLQDPPRLIPAMLALWKQGHQVVYGIRRSLPDGPVTAGLRRAFYAGMRALSDDDLPRDAGEFRLVDARILTALRGVDDTSPYLRGLISAMGFSQVGLLYDREARIAGTSKFPLAKMLGLAVDALLNHSLVPLRVASITGLVVGTCSFVMALCYLVARMAFGQLWPAGFATTTMLMLMAITLNAIFLGIIGEYLGRIFMQVKGRPQVMIETEIDNRISSPPLAAEPEARVQDAPAPAVAFAQD